MAGLIGGKFTIACDGMAYYASGVFKYGGGFDKQEAVMHSNGLAGRKSTPTVAYISGELLDNKSLVLSDIANMTDSTITLDLANGKQIVLRGAYSTNDNGLEADTDGKITIKFEGMSLEQVPAQ